MVMGSIPDWGTNSLQPYDGIEIPSWPLIGPQCLFIFLFHCIFWATGSSCIQLSFLSLMIQVRNSDHSQGLQGSLMAERKGAHGLKNYSRSRSSSSSPPRHTSKKSTREAGSRDRRSRSPCRRSRSPRPSKPWVWEFRGNNLWMWGPGHSWGLLLAISVYQLFQMSLLCYYCYFFFLM